MRAIAIYGVLLRAYPAPFRHEYGREMTLAFAAQMRDARQQGGLRAEASIWISAVFDVLITAPREHAHVIRQDLRYAIRTLASQPAFATVAVLSLALGIGANTAIFSLVNAVLLRPVPYLDPERLVAFNKGTPPDLFDRFTYPDFADYRELNTVFDGLVCVAETALNLSERGQTERVHGLSVSGNYFSTLGVAPALGRGFLLEEERAQDARPVAVLSYGLWQRRLAPTRRWSAGRSR